MRLPASALCCGHMCSQAAAKGKPFYMQINPAACHTACDKGEEGGGCTYPVPAARHKGLMRNISVPRVREAGRAYVHVCAWGMQWALAMQRPAALAAGVHGPRRNRHASEATDRKDVLHACMSTCPAEAQRMRRGLLRRPPKHHACLLHACAPPMQTSNWGFPFEPQLDISPRNPLDDDSPATGIERHYQLRLESMLAVDEMIESIGEDAACAWAACNGGPGLAMLPPDMHPQRVFCNVCVDNALHCLAGCVQPSDGHICRHRGCMRVMGACSQHCQAGCRQCPQIAALRGGSAPRTPPFGQCVLACTAPYRSE